MLDLKKADIIEVVIVSDLHTLWCHMYGVLQHCYAS